ncbi:MAG TPA: serine/threonine-protein kinase [Holophagaceae bacterium]|nr:serine/threonine-protein kinase [Holophagaceae bacterium]
MFSLDLESRILKLASDRGFLDQASRDDLDPLPLTDPEALKHSTSFGPRLDRLVSRGVLTRDRLDALVWEVVLGHEAMEESGSRHAALSGRGTSPPIPREAAPVDRFQDLELIGEGATSKVYKAFDPKLQRWVALKFIRAARADLLERILAEARAQAKVEHPNVCRVHEVGQLGEEAYILMELARGATLDKAIPALDLQAKIRMLRDVAEGVHAAHRQGLIHLDLKAGNILLQPVEGGGFRPLITDFGMVVTEDGVGVSALCPMGTPPYSSPEQLRGDPRALDRRSDIYSLGALLYTCLCGEFPFDAPDFQGLLEAIQNRDPVPIRRRNPSISEDLEAIIETCMAKDPAKRYPSAQALADDLQRYLAGEPVQAFAHDRRYRLKKLLQRHRLVGWTALVFLVLLIGFAALGLREIYLVNTRARLTAEFQREADEIEVALRDAYGMPFHDITPEVEKVRARMSRIESRMASEGRLATGPGEYALGRANLILGDPEAALGHLQGAWNAGFHSPEAAAALGEAYGRIYFLKLVEHSNNRQFPMATFFVDQEMASSVLERLRKDYAEPSRRFFEQGQASLSPERRIYFEGLMALHQGQVEVALQKARELQELTPWEAEGPLLESEGQASLVRRALGGGKYGEAMAPLARMEASIQRARELARSSPVVSEAEDQRQFLNLLALTYQNKAMERDFQEALQASDHHLQLAPRSWIAYTSRANIFVAWSDRLQTSEGDMITPLRRAVDASDRALALKPGFTWALNTKATALASMSILGRRFLGQDFSAAAHQALDIYRGLMPASPFKDQILYNMGQCYSGLGMYEVTHGVDSAREDLEEGIRCFTKSAELNPTSLTYFSLGTPCKWRGVLAESRGEDPRPFYNQSIEAFQRSVSLSPKVHITWGRLADLLIIRARYRLQLGLDPASDVEAAVEASKRSIELLPMNYIGHINLAEATMVQAEWKTRHSVDPSSDLDLAERELKEARKWFPKDPESLMDFVVLARERVRWALATQTPFERFLGQGIDYTAKVLQLNPTHAQVCLEEGRMLLLAAEGAGNRKDPRSGHWHQEGRRALEKALSLNPFLRHPVERVIQEDDRQRASIR